MRKFCTIRRYRTVSLVKIEILEDSNENRKPIEIIRGTRVLKKKKPRPNDRISDTHIQKNEPSAVFFFHLYALSNKRTESERKKASSWRQQKWKTTWEIEAICNWWIDSRISCDNFLSCFVPLMPNFCRHSKRYCHYLCGRLCALLVWHNLIRLVQFAIAFYSIQFNSIQCRYAHCIFVLVPFTFARL